MIDHFEIITVNFNQCVDFYEKVLQPLSIELKWSDKMAAGFGSTDHEKVEFLIEKSASRQFCHIAFSALNATSVDQFHFVGVSGGYKCNGKPGIRENYAPNYYAAFLYDPDGNNIEAVVHL